MANEDTALREVDQELAEERQWAMFRQYGPMVISGAIAIVLGVGGWQFWNARQDGIAQRQALEFRNAAEILAENASDGRDALKAIADEASSGYSTLAAIQRAASFARSGERLNAIQAYREVYNNNDTPKHLRDLTRIRAGYLALSDGREAVMDDVGDLAESGSAYTFHAQEILGLAALEAEDYETAISVFRQLSIDLSAPATIRERAEDFAALAGSGKAGVNIKGETQLDDLLSAVGEGAENPLAGADDHAGHGHEAGDESIDGDADLIDAASDVEQTTPASGEESPAETPVVDENLGESSDVENSENE